MHMRSPDGHEAGNSRGATEPPQYVPIEQEHERVPVRASGGLRRRAVILSVLMLLATGGTVSAAPWGAPPAEAATNCRVNARTLRAGSSGEDVRRFEQRLVQLKYFSGNPSDGRFDQETRHAVIAVQKQHGLTRDGIAGPQTHGALKCASTPKARFPKSGKHAEVSIDRQLVYMFDGGRVTGIFDASTGRKGRETPKGNFRVSWKKQGRNESSEFPGAYLYNPSYFTNRGHAIHGADSVPTSPASSGCVRVSVAASRSLAPQLPVQRRIHIY